MSRLLVRAFAGASILASCPALAELQVTVDPPRVVLGVQSQVAVTVKNVTPGKAVHSFASRGSLSPTTRQPTEAAFFWNPPQSHVPDTALLAFWTEGEPPEVGVVSLPLLGRTDVQADTEPGATVTVEIGGRTFGPERANKKGHVSVPVEVPPGSRDAKVIGVAGDQKTVKEVKLDVPLSNPLAVAFTSEPLVAHTKNWLVVLEAEAFPPDAIGVQFAGATSALRATHAGWALYEVVPDGLPTGVDVRVDLRDHPEAHAEAHATVVAPATPPEPPHTPHAWYPSLEVGGFYGGSSNGGISAALGGGYALPIPKVSTWIEAQVGVRSLGLTGNSAGGGSFDVSIAALTLEAALRGRIIARGNFELSARLGGGLEPFWMTLSNSLIGGTPPQSSSGSIPEGFVALQGSVVAGSFDFYLEVRGALTGSIQGHDPNNPTAPVAIGIPLSGLYFLLGARYMDR